MATTTTAHDSTGTRAGLSSSLFWTRLGSFLAVFPLGIWTIGHLWNNLSAFRGADAWQESVTGYRHPIAMVGTFLVSLLPLVLHTIWGLKRMFTFRPNITRYSNFDNLKYILQRVTALGALFFIGAHVWMAFLRPRLLAGHAEAFSDISASMRWHLPTLLVYVIGTLGVSFHLANGISSFAWTWGLAAGRRSFRRYDVLAITLFVLLTAMAWGSIYALYQAGAAYPPPAH
jgi:succinate dehydrogenase / fumarate reductase cytochrome b subunit